LGKGKTAQLMTRQSRAGTGKGRAGKPRAKHDTAGKGRAKHDKAGQGREAQHRAGQEWAGQGRVWEDTAGQQGTGQHNLNNTAPSVGVSNSKLSFTQA